MTRSTMASPHVFRRGLAFLVLFLLAPKAFGDESATGDIKRACVAQHETAQLLRRAGKLVEARATMLACTQDPCPPVIRSDCATMLEGVVAAIPTVVVRATTGSRGEENVRVTVDGRFVTTRLDGQPMEMDPGVHVFHFDTPDYESVEQQVVLAEGEKDRPLNVAFSSPEASGPAPAGAVSDTRRPVPVAAYALGGVGLAGIGVFSGFGLSGVSERSSLQSSCSPTCSDSQIHSVRTKFLVADIGLGVGVVSLAAATYFFLRRPTLQGQATARGGHGEPPGLATTVALVPTPSAITLRVEGGF